MHRIHRVWTGWPVILVAALLNHLPLWVHLQRNGLGRDELQSATYAILSLRDLLLSVSTFDPHPPVYYLQLHFWLKLGAGDAWLKANPVFWGVLVSLSLYFVIRRLFDAHTAFWASLVFTLLPAVMNYTIAVRMYALLLFAIVWVWYFTWHWFAQDRRWFSALGLLAASLLFLYSFGACFLLFFSAPCYATLLGLQDFTGRRRRWLGYLGLQSLLVALYIPWLYRAADISLKHTLRPGLMDIAATLTHFLYGELIQFQFPFTWVLVVGAGVFTWLVARALFVPELRPLILSFVLAPLLAAALISLLVRPVWLTRSLIFLLPFLALALGRLLAAWQQHGLPAWERAWLASVTVSLVVGIFTFYVQFDTWRPALPVVETVRQFGRPGDLVVVPDERFYRGVAWYFAGPGSVSPLRPTDDDALFTPDRFHLVGSGGLSPAETAQVDWILDPNPANYLSTAGLPLGYAILERGQFTDVKAWQILSP